MVTQFIRIHGSSDLVALRNKRKGIIDIRFMADFSKKCVYVWDAENNIHQNAAKALQKFIEGNYFDITRFFTGTASLEGTSLTYKNSDMLDGILRDSKKKLNPSSPKDAFLLNMRNLLTSKKDLFADMYSFVDKYIDKASSFFKSIKS